uniref:Uncharacterized protein n=1 Tax=Cacopsylla melanoneura TaxID=428564 RepID=A0A8D8QUJ1_9HEMI
MSTRIRMQRMHTMTRAQPMRTPACMIRTQALQATTMIRLPRTTRPQHPHLPHPPPPPGHHQHGSQAVAQGMRSTTAAAARLALPSDHPVVEVTTVVMKTASEGWTLTATWRARNSSDPVSSNTNKNVLKCRRILLIIFVIQRRKTPVSNDRPLMLKRRKV